MGRPSAPEWGAHKSVGLFPWLWFVFRSTIIMLVVDNPLSWKLGIRGDLNKFDDIEGACLTIQPYDKAPTHRRGPQRTLLPARRASPPSC